MKIKEKIRVISEAIKYKRRGKELERLNKNIEMMTLKEVEMELSSKLSKINKLNEIDNRTEELINYSFQLYHGKIGNSLIIKILVLLKDDDLKLQFLDKYADKIDDKTLEEILFLSGYDSVFGKNIDDDAKVKRENRINKIKTRINSITSKFARRKPSAEIGKPEEGFFEGDYIYNPLELKIKWDERERVTEENRELIKKIKSKIFSKNYDRINIFDFIKNNVSILLLENIYDELPEDVKVPFLFEYIRVNENNIYNPDERERLEQNLLKAVPMDILKNEIIKNLDLRSNSVWAELAKKVELNFGDVQNYYRQSGHWPHLSMEYDYIKAEIKTANEVISELKYFKGDEREKFFNSVRWNLSEEEQNKLLESDEIEDEFKFDIYRVRLYEKSDEKKLEIYEKLLLSTKDEKTKNDYRISIAEIKGNYDEILEIIKSGEYNSVIDESVLLKFSDEQLKELYDTTEHYELRSRLLTLSRRKKDYSQFWNGERDEEEQEEGIDKFILVNNENFVEFIKNAKSYDEILNLLNYEFQDYQNDVAFGQVLELYQNLINKELNFRMEIQKKWCIDRVKGWLTEDLTIDNYLKLIDIGYPKADFIQALRIKGIKENLTIEDIESYIQNINQIQDISLKESLFDSIIKKYLSTPYSSNNPDEYEQYEKRVANLENLYERLLESSDVDILDKYFLLSKYMMESYKRDSSKHRDKNFIDKFTTKFSKLNEEAGKSEYTEIFDFTPVYKYRGEWKEKINCTNYKDIINCIKCLGSDIIYDKLVNLYNQNHSIKQNINSTMLNDSIIQLLDADVFEFFSRYRTDASDFSKVLEDEDKVSLFIHAYDRLKSIKAYSEEDALKLISFIKTLNPEEFMKDNNIDGKNVDLIIGIALSENLRWKFSKMSEGENNAEKYIENIKEDARNEIHSPLLTRVQALDAIGTRFFGLSYKEMRDLVNKYAADLGELLDKYREKEQKAELSVEEQNEYSALRVLRNLKEILAIQDKKALIETFEELDKLEEFKNIDFALASTLGENIRRAYAKDYKENIYYLKEEDKLEEKVDGIDVYSPKEFNMLVHVVAAYGNFKLIDKEHPEKSAKEFWRNVEDKKNHILCTSYIGSSNLCCKRRMEDEKIDKDKAEIIFGFSNFSKNSILMAAPYDMASSTDTRESEKSFLESRFRTGKNMLKNTRWNHNEICVERRLENQKETNIEPDYIVCFDEINEESKKVAKDFGIPIVLIDTKEVAKNESEKLDKLLKRFYETKDASKIAEILTLYQTNLNSFNNFRTELVEKYFNLDKMNENIQNLMQWIDKEYKLGDRDNAIRCYKALYEAFKNEIKVNLESGIDPEEISKGQLKIREFNYLAKQSFERVKHHLDNSTQATETADCEQNEQRAFEIISKVKERNQNNGR